MTTASTLASGQEIPAKETNWAPLLLLLILVIPLRGWLMWHTEVLARDSVIYINYAMEIERLSWQEALLGNHQHPGYPLSILAVSVPVRWLLGPADCFTLQLSAQLASNLAALLLIFPMYYLGRFFFERRVAFWGTLLYQYLPASGQHLSDGVSEALFLLLTSTAFLCSLWAMRRQSLLLFMGCGIFCGLAYLTRPEGVLVLVSTILVLCLGPLLRSGLQSWKVNLGQALAMTLAGLAVGSLYFGFTHTFTNKPSVNHILHGRPQKPGPSSANEQNAAVGRPEGETDATTLFASIFGNALERNVPLLNRLGKGLVIFGVEYFRIFHHVGFLALAFGTMWRLRNLLAVREFLVPCLFVLLHCLLILGLACKAGYLSNRHLLGVAVWGVFFAVAGFCDFPSRLGQWWRGKEWLSIFRSEITPTRSASEGLRTALPSRVSLLLLLAFLGLCLPRTMQKLHASQVGNRLAGLWLAKHMKKVDFIRDDHSWSLYYAGAIFQDPPEPPPGHDPRCFVVITRSRDSAVKKQQTWQEKDLRNGNGAIVYHWPENVSAEEARVVVYSVHRQKERWWNEKP